MKFSLRLIIHTKSVVHMKWLVIVNRYIVQVITLRSSTNSYSILTHCVLQFHITRTVPVCCIAQGFKVTFFTVEHKNLRIRSNLFYVKLFKALLLWCYLPLLFDSPEQHRINENVKINVNCTLYLRNICDIHIYVYSVSYCSVFNDISNFRKIRRSSTFLS